MLSLFESLTMAFAFDFPSWGVEVSSWWKAGAGAVGRGWGIDAEAGSSWRGLTELDDMPSEGAVLGLDCDGVRVPVEPRYDPDGVPEDEIGPAKMGCWRGNSDPTTTEPGSNELAPNPPCGAPVRFEGEMNWAGFGAG